MSKKTLTDPDLINPFDIVTPKDDLNLGEPKTPFVWAGEWENEDEPNFEMSEGD